MAVLTPWVVASRDAAVTGVASINGKQGDVTLEEAGIAASGANKDITSLEGLVGPLRLNAQGVDEYDAVTVGQLNAATGGGGGTVAAAGAVSDFIGSVSWWNGSTTSIPSGYVIADGRLLNRADYPDLWSLVNSGAVNVIQQNTYASTDDAWLNTPTGRGAYSKGDDSTTFRVPDLNGSFAATGSYPASIPGLFLRGSGVANLAGYGTGGLGTVRKSASPDIQGATWEVNWTNVIQQSTGAFFCDVLDQGQEIGYTPSGGDRADMLSFAASRYNSVYGQDAVTQEVRPSSVTGVWIIRANGNFTSASTVFSVRVSDEEVPDAGTTITTGAIHANHTSAGESMYTVELSGYKKMGDDSNTVAAIYMNDDELNTSTSYIFPWTGTANTVATVSNVASVKSLMEERLVEMEAMVAAQAETIRLLNMRHSAFEARMKALEQEVVNGRVSEE